MGQPLARRDQPVYRQFRVKPEPKVSSMKRIVIATAVAFAVVCPAAAQEKVPLNPKVRTDYAPTDKFTLLQERLRARGMLEQYSQFLSPLRLRQDLTVWTEQCGLANAWFDPSKRKITLCYEYLTEIEDEVAKPAAELPGPLTNRPGVGLMPGFTRAEVIIGAMVGVLLHETGHAIFNIQEIPRLGREEDAADGVSGLIMLQFGKSVALTMIKGRINNYYHRHNKYGFDPRAMSDVHSMDIQRLYNYLCLAYGSEHRAAFQALADKYLPAVRRPNCEIEYKQAKRAFDKTIMPDVDLELLKRVQAMPILRPEDMKL